MDERPRKRRFFVGIALDDAARAGCAAALDALRGTGFSAKYESVEKLHITLAFLGFVDPQRFDDLVAAARECARHSNAFSVTLDKIGAFPHERRPRVVYVGAREQGAHFRALAVRLRDAYVRLGFEFENDAVVHVTIARVKESARPLPQIEFTCVPVSIGAITLFESLPDPLKKTSRYEIAARAPFELPEL